MTTNSIFDTKWQHQEDEEEALSLCDLPLKDDQESHEPEDREPATEPEQEEFDFASMSDSVLTDQEMCAADDVFFKGQILPLRLSFSSDRGLNRNNSRSMSRSESMDHGSSTGFTSISSRSSSINSSSTSSSNPYKPKLRNQFHAHPSPNPQIRTSGSRTTNRSRRWSVWDIFRLGLVQTPEIELENLKVRTTNYKSFVPSNFNKNGSTKKSKNHDSEDQNKPVKRHGLGFLCWDETVSFDAILVRSKSTSSNSRKNKKATNQKMTRHRTCEWLKELSHGSTLNHQIVG